MRLFSINSIQLLAASTIIICAALGQGNPSQQILSPSSTSASLSTTFTSPRTPSSTPVPNPTKNNISFALFADLEELSRIVDIAYCITTPLGLTKPFNCASRCADFPNFELVSTFNSADGIGGGLVGGDGGVGYVALDHGRSVGEGGEGKMGRVLVVFRGTYSLRDTISDLSSGAQEYEPYPGPENGKGDGDDGKGKRQKWWRWPWYRRHGVKMLEEEGNGEGKIKCNNCSVHTGFYTSYQNTRPLILGHIEWAKEKYPGYEVHLVGHSLGGALACLAGLELDALGYDPTITTFGEPRVGNRGLVSYIDSVFGLNEGNVGGEEDGDTWRYRRVTHIDDPVPLLPLDEWGYKPHAGEIYISKLELQPTINDIHLCSGDEDNDCSVKSEVDESWFGGLDIKSYLNEYHEAIAKLPEFEAEVEVEVVVGEGEAREEEEEAGVEKRWGIPTRYKMWQLFFAHRDYFWRLGLCVPGGDPVDWGRGKYDLGNGGQEVGREEL